MKTNFEGNVLTIEFDAPWEQEVIAYISRVYGPNYVKTTLTKLLLSKQRGMDIQEAIAEVEKKRGTVESGRVGQPVREDAVRNPR